MKSYQLLSYIRSVLPFEGEILFTTTKGIYPLFILNETGEKVINPVVISDLENLLQLNFVSHSEEKNVCLTESEEVILDYRTTFTIGHRWIIFLVFSGNKNIPS